jgi:hypothetical protein
MLAAAMLLVLLPGAVAQTQSTSALINQALDQPVKIQLDTVLPEAMASIGRTTGVRLEAAPAVWELLPWGQQTNINARIENQSLRQALDIITRKLGLVYVLRDEAIELQPMPALQRLGRRATVDELQVLDVVTVTPLNLKAERPTVKQVVDALDARLAERKSEFAVVYSPGNKVRSEKVLSVPRNVTLAEALELVARETDLTWFPFGKGLQVVPKEEQVRMQLQRKVSLRFPGVDIAQVLAELSEQAGLPFEMEPGAVQRVPPEFRSIHLVLDNSPLSQALETISGFTGLGHVVTSRGVYFWNQSGEAAATRDPIIGAITIEGSGVQLFLRQSEVPADLREFLKARSQKELEKLRTLMREQGFKPGAETSGPGATSSTTQPASNRLDQFRR